MKKNNHPNRDWRPKWKFENGIATHLPTGRAYTRDENNEIIICKAEENPVSDDGKLYRQAKKLLSASPPEPSTEANWLRHFGDTWPCQKGKLPLFLTAFCSKKRHFITAFRRQQPKKLKI